MERRLISFSKRMMKCGQRLSAIAFLYESKRKSSGILNNLDLLLVIISFLVAYLDVWLFLPYQISNVRTIVPISTINRG